MTGAGLVQRGQRHAGVCNVAALPQGGQDSLSVLCQPAHALPVVALDPGNLIIILRQLFHKKNIFKEVDDKVGRSYVTNAVATT